MLAVGTTERRWAALVACGLLASCAAPGEPMSISPVALSHAQVGTPPRIIADKPHGLTHAPWKPVAVAAAPPVVKAVARPEPAVSSTGTGGRFDAGGSTTVAATPASSVDQTAKPAATPPLVPSPTEDLATFSPLSPIANPVALVPPGALRAAARLQAPHDVVLPPGPSLCDLNDGATAADVLLNANPCPAALRPTLKPGEPVE